MTARQRAAVVLLLAALTMTGCRKPTLETEAARPVRAL